MVFGWLDGVGSWLSRKDFECPLLDKQSKWGRFWCVTPPPAKHGWPGDKGIQVDIAWINTSLCIIISWELVQAIRYGNVGQMANLTPTLLFSGNGTSWRTSDVWVSYNKNTPSEWSNVYPKDPIFHGISLHVSPNAKFHWKRVSKGMVACQCYMQDVDILVTLYTDEWLHKKDLTQISADPLSIV